ncbi:hypothetical protein [Synechococcus sp. 1G10]|uniref:hypothetical protein n=1 Tax=Synechococcus sp. 1G10 TaxID=2025605 RepID=UPI00117D492A|nr:hypothetical protein [Synechococcus sp. 1G10]
MGVVGDSPGISLIDPEQAREAERSGRRPGCWTAAAALAVGPCGGHEAQRNPEQAQAGGAGAMEQRGPAAVTAANAWVRRRPPDG